MSIRPYVVILMLISAQGLCSQTWNSIYGQLNNSDSDSVAFALDGAQFVSFTDNGPVIIYVSGDYLGDDFYTAFMSISWEGEELFSKRYGETDYDWYLGWTSTGDKCADGGFVNAGSYVSLEPDENEFDNSNSHLIRFDAEGDTLWRKVYPDYRDMAANKVIECSDGGFALVGTVESDTASFNTQVFLLRTDAEGNELWRREYGDTLIYDEFGIYIEEIPDNGGFFLGGFWYDNPNWDALLLRVNESGDLLWSETYGTDFGAETAFGINRTSNDEYILTNSLSISGDHDISNRKGRIARMDVNGDLMWESLLGRATNNTLFLEATEAEDGGIVAVGRMGDTINGRSAILAKVDGLTGDSLWLREYNYANPSDQLAIELIYDFTPLPDGGFALAGRVVHNEHLGQYHSDDAWVIKVDEYGCVEPGCQLVGLSEQLLGLTESMQVYPNPMALGEAIQIRFEPQASLEMPYVSADTYLQIFDLQGRLVHSQTIAARGTNAAFSLKVDAVLRSGTYSLQWLGKDAWYDAAQLVVLD